MRSVSVEAASFQTAQQLYEALSRFDAELHGSAHDGYSVVVTLRSSQRHIVDVLDVIQKYVSDRDDGPAHVNLDGRKYTVH